MMEFDALLRKRRNVYGFLDEQIRETTLNKILGNARHVPSAGFTQDFDLVVVRDQDRKRRLAEAAREQDYASLEGAMAGFIENAPVVIVPCGNKLRFESKYGSPAEKNARLPWWIVDAAFSALVVILSAFQEGLAASFIGAIDDDKVAETLRLPRDGSIIPLAIIPVGYKHPNEQFGPRKRKTRILRKSVEQIHWDEW